MVGAGTLAGGLQLLWLAGHGARKGRLQLAAIGLENGRTGVVEELSLFGIDHHRHSRRASGTGEESGEVGVADSLVVVGNQQHVDLGDHRLDSLPNRLGVSGSECRGHFVVESGNLLSARDDSGLGGGRPAWHCNESARIDPQRGDLGHEGLTGGIVTVGADQGDCRSQGDEVGCHVGRPAGRLAFGADGDDRDRSFGGNSVDVSDKVAIEHQVAHDPDPDGSHRLEQGPQALSRDGGEDLDHVESYPSHGGGEYLRLAMTRFDLVATRGELDESVHHLSVAVADLDGRLVAHAGNPGLLTYFRSAAKPFQLYPLVHDGGVERFGLDAEMLALGCGSHNGEPIHRAVATRWLERVGITEEHFSCGGHLSLSPAYAREMTRTDALPTPLWSNCSGKHAGLLALAQLHGWPLAGYHRLGHPVQSAVATSVSRWSAVPEGMLQWGVDGCTAAAVALPLTGMATAWARLGAAHDGALTTIRGAMMGHPLMVAGADRLDTVLMQRWPGRVLAKVGAEGVYGAALPELGLGIGLKVEDGDFKCAAHAVMAVIEQVVARFGQSVGWPMEGLDAWRTPPIRNTRGEVVGAIAVRGTLTFA